jgi:TPR repeat protein
MRRIVMGACGALLGLLTHPAHAQTGQSYKEAPSTECDTYTADPFDPQRTADGVPYEKINAAQAIPSCKSAVQQYPSSKRLPYQLGRALLKNDQFDAALTQIRTSAQQGYAPAQLVLGNMYENGQGVPKDQSQTAYWYRKAAEQGFAPAQHNVGTIYLNGNGLPKNETEAFAWFLRAANQGLARAQASVGFMYGDGRGVPKDERTAVIWLRKGAEQGDPNAQFDLGIMYQGGRGVAVDYSQALRWYRKAAEQGNALAQLNLGVMYQNGLGVPKDEAQAVAWYLKAAAQGNKQAQSNLAPLKAKVEINEKFDNAKQQGYQSISFEDFKLDGKKLAATGGKVMMQGFYQKLGDIELLQPTGVAVAVARSRGDDGNGIGLLTDDASRDVRKGLLRCGDPMIAPLGCQITFIGHVNMCTMTTLVGSKDLPCLAVEDGW